MCKFCIFDSSKKSVILTHLLLRSSEIKVVFRLVAKPKVLLFCPLRSIRMKSLLDAIDPILLYPSAGQQRLMVMALLNLLVGQLGPVYYHNLLLISNKLMARSEWI